MSYRLYRITRELILFCKPDADSESFVCAMNASTLADLDSIVVADYGAISLTKPGSSVAQIKEKHRCTRGTNEIK